MAKKYIGCDPTKGYPSGKYIFYECGICKGVLPSMLLSAAIGRCKKIAIDTDAGRVSIKDERNFLIFKNERT